RLLGYAIGVANIQNCNRNGMAYLTSRYSTLSADSHKPTPSPAPSAIRKKSGIHTRCLPGTTPSISMTTISMARDKMKSMIPATTAEIGTVRRRKYTVVTRFAFDTRLLAAAESPFEKNVQITSPDNLKTA